MAADTPVSAEKQLLLFGKQPAVWNICVDVRDWSTPYVRFGRFNQMNFATFQFFCLSITRYWS